MKNILFPLVAACLASAPTPGRAQSQTPAHAAPLAQDYAVVFHNPDPEYYVEGPGLVKQDDGTFVAIVPVVPRHAWSKERRVENSRIHILDSADAGKTWRKLSTLPYYSAVPWTHDGALYLFANKPGTEFRNDDLLLLRSRDGGKTWSEPVTLFEGHFWNCHTGLVIRDKHLYWAVDDLGFGAKRGPVAIAGDLTKDPMDPKSWRRSNAVPFPGIPDALVNPRFSDQDSLYLEPNVIDVGGKLRVLATVKPQNQTTANLCAVFDVSDEAGELGLKFVQFSPMPGGQLKFTVFWDDASKLFWSTANLVADSQQRYSWWTSAKDGKLQGSPFGGNDRRFLMLQYSVDGLNWFQAGCVARAGKTSQSFMYARPVIDGDDLAIISRTSVNAPNQHDADYATFHRVRDFRKLALDLFPDAATEAPQVYARSAEDLGRARDRVRAEDPAIQPALHALLSEADQALQMEPLSVMQKTLVAASGDKHDYFSMGPYWWPDPSKPDGKPYVQKDGQVNPASKSGTDSGALNRTCDAVETLGLAYYLTGKTDYAQQAARLVRVWFLDPETRMNPNLNHGQAIPGKTDGRGIGIIETHVLIALTDAVALLDGSATWSADDKRAFYAWLSAYLDWLLESPLGRREKTEYNNHGTWYDAQVAQLALVLGRRELAKETVTNALQTRLAAHVEPDGGQPHELRRTRPLVYSTFNLRALVTLAQQADKVGVDWWNYETADGRSLRKALAFLAPYATPDAKFIKEDIVEVDREPIRELVVTAASRYDDRVFRDTLDRLRHEGFSEERWNLFDWRR